MTASIVQARREETQIVTQTCQPDSNLTTGGLLIAVTKSYVGVLTSLTDDGLGAIGTWTRQQQLANNVNTNHYMEVWTAPIVTGGSRPTVSAVHGGFDWLGLVVIELSGADTSASPFSTSAIDTGVSAPPWAAGTTGTPGTNELSILLAQVDGGTLVTNPSTGYTEFVYTGVTYDNFGFAYKTTSAAESPSYDAAGTDEWFCDCVIVKSASSEINVTPDPVVVEARVDAPSVALDVTPSPVVVEARVVAPGVALKSAPAPVVVQARVVAPTVALHTSPAPVEVEAIVVAPTVTIGGAIVVTPDPVVLIARVVAPTVTLVGSRVDFVGDTPRFLQPGQQYGVEPEWLRELRRRRRPPRVDAPRENPDDPDVAQARLARLWEEQERADEEWILGL